MDPNAISAVGVANAAAGPSLWALFLQADVIVKVVMSLLLVASLWCWAVILDKGFRLVRLKRKANAFERAFWSGAPLDELYRKLAKRADHPMALMFATADGGVARVAPDHRASASTAGWSAGSAGSWS